MTSRVKVLYPYLSYSTWVFDDQATGLKEEAFVRGMTQIISRLVTEKGIDNASAGFALHFSDEPIPDGDVVMQAGAPDMGGTWYSGQVMGEQMEGWLCPALFLYFATAPDWTCPEKVDAYLKGTTRPSVTALRTQPG